MNIDKLFIAALENKDIKTLKKLPKTDLHNHFGNGGNREYIIEKTGAYIPPLTEKLKSMDDMHKWIDTYLTGLFDSAEKRKLQIEACFMQAKQDGITVLEIGDDVWANGHFYNYNIDDLIDAFTRIHSEVSPEIDFRFQIGLSRHCSINLLEKWIEPFFERDCFYSLDLYCDEMAQPIKNFKGIYRKAKDKGLLLKAHIGEWGEADSVKEAVVELALDEVQHGISAANSTSIMNWLADHKIQLNICPTSNVLLDRVESLKVHPIRRLYDYGVRVTINSDDVLIFGQSVSDEYLSLYQNEVFSANELNQIRRNGLESRS